MQVSFSRGVLKYLRGTVGSNETIKFQTKIILQPKRRAFVRTYFGSVKPENISYLFVPGEIPLINKTIGHLVNSTADQFENSEALFDVEENKRLSFVDVKNESDQLASGLIKIGLQPGDRLGIWGPNSYKWFISELAAAKAGLISVFLNPAYQPRELHYSLNKVGMKAIVIAGNFKTQDYYKMLVEVVPEVDKSSVGQVKSANVPLTTVITMEEEARGKGTFTYSEILSEGASNEAIEIMSKISSRVQFDDVCNIQFTSGTTGNPKGVMLSHYNIVNNSYLVGRRLQLSSKDKLCLPVPLFHCYGNVCGILAAMHYGTLCVLPSPGFSAIAAIQMAAQERCTLMYGTPTMHVDMINIPNIQEYDLNSLRTAVTAGSVCPVELVKEMKRNYTVDSVTHIYGLTETISIFQSLPSDSDELRASTIGYPQEHTEVKLVDKEGHIVPIGTEGEMCVRNKMVMQGYWDDPKKTAETIDSARWFHTGDLFVMSKTGHATIVGRLKDMIIRGGENIYPREIEDCLHTHPLIVEAQVFGVPDKRLGETVATWLRLKDGAKLTEKDVQEFCKGQISHFKIPKYIIFTSNFPKTSSGKIQKFVMRDETIIKNGWRSFGI